MVEQPRHSVPPNRNAHGRHPRPAARETRGGLPDLEPSDLSFDLEAHPEHPFKSVDDCLRHVLQQLEGTDIRVSFRNYSPDLRNKYMDMGVTVFMERPRV